MESLNSAIWLWPVWGEYIFLSTPSCSATLENKSFLNSVPLSVSSFLQTPNGNAMWSLQTVAISSADLFLIGMQNVYPVSIHTAVNAYLLPLDEGGWNSPIKSILTNSISSTPGLNICFPNCVFWTFCTAHTLQFLQYHKICNPHTFPVI